MAVAGSTIDFLNLGEGVNALQRNPLVDNIYKAAGGTSVTASAIMAVVVPAGTAVVYDTAGVQYSVAAPGLVFPFGAPIGWSPRAGQVNISSSGAYTLVYHL